MGSPSSWVEGFKAEHECDEHWELRRNFLLTHKDKFPEDRLVCLAQVFTNVEFMGCRYPEKTMQLVAELSKDVAASYRERQKTRLQRTFVKASDAAGAKAKGLKRPQDQTSESHPSSSINNGAQETGQQTYNVGPKAGCAASKKMKFQKFVAASSDPPPIVEIDISEDSPESSRVDSNFQAAAAERFSVKKPQDVIMDTDERLSEAQRFSLSNAMNGPGRGGPSVSAPNTNLSRLFSFSHYGGVRTYHIDRPPCNIDVNSMEEDEEEEEDPLDKELPNLPPDKEKVAAALNAINTSPYGKLVLIEMLENADTPLQIIHRSTSSCQQPVNYAYERISANKVSCKLYINKRLVASGIGATNKAAKDIAANLALPKLREHCFTVKIKSKILTDGTTIEKNRVPNPKEKKGKVIGEDNIGNKLLRMMGWTGGGLGKDQQGIEEPVKVQQRINRSGLGIQPKSSESREFFVKMTRLLKDFAAQNSDHDLVFSSDFSKEERKKMHEISQKFNLKTKSYGKETERYLVVSHKTNIMRIVEKMLHCGGSNEKYELMAPTTLTVFTGR